MESPSIIQLSPPNPSILEPPLSSHQIDAESYEIRPDLILLVQSNPFLGETAENPYPHFQQFELVCSTVKIPGLPLDALKWKLFPFSLKDKARTWYFRHVHEAEGKWSILQDRFCLRYFPLKKIADLRRKVITFEQEDHEPLGAAWERQLSYTTAGPDLSLPECVLLQHFVLGLQPDSAKFLDTAAGGAFVYRTPSEGLEILAKILQKLDTPLPLESVSQEVREVELSPAPILPVSPVIEEVTKSPVFGNLDPYLFLQESPSVPPEPENEVLRLPSAVEDDLNLSEFGNAYTQPVESKEIVVADSDDIDWEEREDNREEIFHLSSIMSNEWT
jgi:hypothetical protein